MVDGLNSCVSLLLCDVKPLVLVGQTLHVSVPSTAVRETNRRTEVSPWTRELIPELKTHTQTKFIIGQKLHNIKQFTRHHFTQREHKIKLPFKDRRSVIGQHQHNPYKKTRITNKYNSNSLYLSSSIFLSSLYVLSVRISMYS